MNDLGVDTPERRNYTSCRYLSSIREVANGSAIYAGVSAGVCGRDDADHRGVGGGDLAGAISADGAAAVVVVGQALDAYDVQTGAAGDRSRAAVVQLPFRGGRV